MNRIRTTAIAAATIATAATTFAVTSSTSAGYANRETNTYWAVVDPNLVPSMQRDQGAMYASAAGTETSVRFERDISMCSYTATVGSPWGFEVEPGFATVRTSPVEPSAVRVATYSANGDPAILPFHLHVMCWDTDWSKVKFFIPEDPEG